MIWLQIY